MSTIHRFIGFAIVAGFLVLAFWGLIAFIVKRDPTRWFWRLLAVLQVVLIIQLVAGLILLLTGHRRVLLHYAYGALFPAIVLVGAHVIARELEEPGDAWRVFAIAAFILFGLTLRALTTGLGLP
ncbi:MAG TPA: hypothetical protein VF660_08190 [Actinomycetota bacterium]|jgi:heme/copper-type cytochrome/quinol oxidase subunit 4